MKIQFDECFNDKSVIRACKEEGKATPLPMPDDLLHTKDPILIPKLIERGNPIITIDGTFLDDNTQQFPEQHPGVIIIQYSYAVKNRELDTKKAGRILREFKRCVGAWLNFRVKNSIIFLTERTVEIHHMESGKPVRDLGIRYTKLADDGDEDFWVNYEAPAANEVELRLNQKLLENADRRSAKELPADAKQSSV